MQIVKLNVTKEDAKEFVSMDKDGNIEFTKSTAIPIVPDNIYYNSECLFQFSSNIVLKTGTWYMIDCTSYDYGTLPKPNYLFDNIELLIGGTVDISKVWNDDETLGNNLDGADLSSAATGGILLTIKNPMYFTSVLNMKYKAYFKYDGTSTITIEE